MAQDILSDALNQIMNAKKVGKTEVEIKRTSKLLISLLELMKKDGYIDFKKGEKEGKETILIEIKELNECKAIKPRFYVSISEIDKYSRRYLPSRKFGELIISTSKGLLKQGECYDKNIGGSLIAYYY